MKDITSTSFGLVIAFLLPGIVLLLAISEVWKPMEELLKSFRTSQSTVGLFLMVVLYALILGLQISAARWIVYELCICRKQRIDSDLFRDLSENTKLDAFRACVDEHYRYHQFWGGMSLVLPILFIIMYKTGSPLLTKSWYKIGAALIIEVITVCVARDAYIKYSSRATGILKG